jgi:hypothetical protein
MWLWLVISMTELTLTHTGGEDSGGGVAFAMYKSLLLGPADRKIHLTTQV